MPLFRAGCHLARNEPYPQPQPIILDSDLRISTTCKLLTNCQQSKGRRPCVVCSDVFTPEKRQRKTVLEYAGARVMEIPRDQSGLCQSCWVCLSEVASGISIMYLLETLQGLGIN